MPSYKTVLPITGGVTVCITLRGVSFPITGWQIINSSEYDVVQCNTCPPPNYDLNGKTYYWMNTCVNQQKCNIMSIIKPLCHHQTERDKKHSCDLPSPLRCPCHSCWAVALAMCSRRCSWATSRFPSPHLVQKHCRWGPKHLAWHPPTSKRHLVNSTTQETKYMSRWEGSVYQNKDMTHGYNALQ